MSETFAEEIERVADAPIEAVVISGEGRDDEWELQAFKPCNWPPNKVLSWEEARGWLNVEYDNDFGAVGCPAVYVWTAEHVISVGEYDGATWLVRIPRNPVPCTPQMPGGS